MAEGLLLTRQNLKKTEIDRDRKGEVSIDLAAGSLKRGKLLMMQKLADSVCIRCGKIRVYSKKWVDRAEGKGTQITHIEAVCPDSECQKIVDEKFRLMRERRELAESRKKGITIAKAK